MISDGCRDLLSRSSLCDGYARQPGVQEQKWVIDVRFARIGLVAGRLFSGFEIHQPQLAWRTGYLLRRRVGALLARLGDQDRLGVRMAAERALVPDAVLFAVPFVHHPLAFPVV